MSGDAYRNSEEATRDRLAQLEIELENSQKRIVAVRLEIAATERRFPPENPNVTRQVLVILAIGIDFFFFLTKYRPTVEHFAATLIVALAFVPFALPRNYFAKAHKRRADRASLVAAERERSKLTNQIAEARALLPKKSAVD